MSTPKQERIVLFGGPNAERLVSVASAQNISQGTGAKLWFWSKIGEIYEVSLSELIAHNNPFVKEFIPSTTPIFSNLEMALDDADTRARNPVFILAVHGTVGEDGILQEWLEDRGFKFTGSSSVSSANAFDKVKAVHAVKNAGIQVPQSVICNTADLMDCKKQLLSSFETFGSIVLKPNASGSSDGLVCITDATHIETALNVLAQRQGEDFLIEEMIKGIEITVGVIEREDGAIVALPPSEIRLEKGTTFDYNGKYLGKGSTEITPAQIPQQKIIEAQDVATKAHTLFGCRGYSRTDLFLTDTGFVFIEINTLPGLTKASFIPQELEAAHIPLSQFIEEQITIAQNK
jgi:D-alanine-D-alanine ligase